ncbi:ABC transporter ATP-binding protein [Psychrosphaera aestuarii]|uniref:ABC transporter ATP-binding protein n=1 Tax=Psychrosphaera aestuarii TaxID=1266052 RepID=UPI001B32F58B|nr:ABC transporter ATP-binding protein [Psychrosphaera aestuarii]
MPTTPLFQITNLCWNISTKTILDKVTLTIPRNKIIGIIGPNGAGKTSLLKAMHGQIATSSGSVRFNNSLIQSFSLKERAKHIAYTAQHPDFAFDISLFDVVLAGRLPYQKLFSFSNKREHSLVFDALKKMNLLGKAKQAFNTLSGGEQQRAYLARAMVQEATTLLLDEPTNHLDIRYQLELMQKLQEFDGSVVLTIHDLNMASYYCDYLVLLDKGEVVKFGTPKEVLTKALISKTYQVETEIRSSESGAPHLYFCLPNHGSNVEKLKAVKAVDEKGRHE